MIKRLTAFITVLLFSVGSIGASERELYQRALNNTRNERVWYQQQYPDEKVVELDKKAYKRKTYSRYLKLLYSSLDEVEKILEKRIAGCSSDEIHTSYRGIIFLDAGHGGDDPGATVPPYMTDRSQMVIAEGDVTYEISQMVYEDLTEKGFLVIRSREKVSDGMPLSVRSALCRAIEPDIAVSIHLNSSQYAYPIYDHPETAFSELNYTRVYVWGPHAEDLLIPFYREKHGHICASGSRTKSIKLANDIAEALKGELDLDYTLSDELRAQFDTVKQKRIALSEQLVASRPTSFVKQPLEDFFPTELLAENKTISDMYVQDVCMLPGVEGADLHLVREMPKIPSVLIEPLFISCPEEQRKLLQGNRKEQIADAITNGILTYFQENPATE